MKKVGHILIVVALLLTPMTSFFGVIHATDEEKTLTNEVIDEVSEDEQSDKVGEIAPEDEQPVEESSKVDAEVTEDKKTLEVSDPKGTLESDLGSVYKASNQVRSTTPTDQKYFEFKIPNTITGFVTVIPGGDTAPRDIVFPDTYIDTSGTTQPVLAVGDSAFTGKGAYIDSITLNAGLTRIGNTAFKGCSNITSMIIPANVEQIGNSAFEDCTSLQTVQMNNVLKSIGNNAFNKTAITQIALAESIEEIGSYAFANTKLTSIALPSKLTEVKNNTFEDCVALTSVTLGGNIATIGTSAFKKTAITTINLPINLITIGDSAFYYCSNLTSITFPSKLEKINEKAFYNTNLQSVTIPDSVKTIGGSAFSDCRLLTQLDLGNGVTEIVYEAFSSTDINQLVLPDSLTKLGNSAFQSNRNLSSITFGNGLKTINATVFSNIGITDLDIPDEVETIEMNAFSNCQKLETLTIGSGVKTIAAGAFSNTKLVKINIPANVEIINTTAFMNTNTLTEIKVDHNFNEILGRPWGAINAKVIWNDSNTTPDCFYEKNGVLLGIKDTGHTGCTNTSLHTSTTLNIPDTINGNTVTEIGNAAFQATKYIGVLIPDSVKIIRESAFAQCPNLKNITLSKQIVTIENLAFSSSTIETITLPNTLKTIGDDAFKQCYNLETVDFNEGLETIGIGAFSYCATLNNVNIPDSVKRIGESCFNNTNGLSNITLGKGISILPDSVFLGSGITSIEIPYGVTTIGDSAFASSKLTSVIIPDSVTTMGTNAFSSSSNLTSVQLSNKLKTISPGAFNLTSIEKIVIPNSVQTIGNRAFTQCPTLKEVEFGDNVNSIGSDAFSKSQIEKAIFPESLKRIGDKAFQNCTSLKDISFQQGLEEIGANAFGNTAIENFNKVPDSVKNIASTAFTGSPIKEVRINKLRQECSFKTNEPWGAASATIYYKDDFINMDYTLETVAHQNKKTIAYDFSSGDKAGLIHEIVLPDGSKVNAISNQNYKGDYEVSANGKYTFKALSSTNKEFVYEVFVNDLGQIQMNSDNIVVKKDQLSGFADLEALLEFGNIKAIDQDTGNKLAITSNEALSDIQSALQNNGDYITLSLSATNALGTTVTKYIDVTLDDSAHTVRFMDGTTLLKELQVRDSERLRDWTPTKDWNVFTSWYKDSSFSTTWDFTNDVIHSDTTVYAKWSPYTYKVGFDTGFSDMTVANKDNVIITQDNLLPVTIKKDGYTFEKWMYGSEVVTKDTTLKDILTNEANNSKITLKAYWKQNKYTITYDTDSKDVTYPDKTNIVWGEASLLPSTNPTKKGYTFAGWKMKNQDVSSTTLINDVLETDIDGSNVILKAIWTASQYTINYHFNQSYPQGVTLPNAQTLSYDEQIPNPTIQAPHEWSFIGWYLDENYTIPLTSKQKVVGHMDLYGKWVYSPTISNPPASGAIKQIPPVNNKIVSSKPNTQEKVDHINQPMENKIYTEVIGKLKKDDVKGIKSDQLKKYIKAYTKDGSASDFKVISGYMNNETGKYEVSIRLENGETRTVQIEVENAATNINKEKINRKAICKTDWLIFVMGILYVLYAAITIFKVHKTHKINKKAEIIRLILVGVCFIGSSWLYFICTCANAVWFYIPNMIILCISAYIFMKQHKFRMLEK